jgi:hypothetical protein
MVCLPATSEAGVRWPRIGLVVVATTSRRDSKVQMIRPQMSYFLNVNCRYLVIVFNEIKVSAGIEACFATVKYSISC